MRAQTDTRTHTQMHARTHSPFHSLAQVHECLLRITQLSKN